MINYMFAAYSIGLYGSYAKIESKAISDRRFVIFWADLGGVGEISMRSYDIDFSPIDRNVKIES